MIRNKRVFLIVSAVIALVGTVAAGTAFMAYRSNINTQETSSINGDSSAVLSTARYVNDKHNLQFDYDARLKATTLSEKDIEDKFILRLNSENPAVSVTVRYEDGLRTVSSLANIDTLELISSNALRALPNRYPQYNYISESSTEVGGKDATYVEFTYVGGENTVIKQRLYIIEVSKDKVLYMSMQTLNELFNEIDNGTFTTILDTLVI